MKIIKAVVLLMLMTLINGCSVSLITVTVDSNITKTECKTTNGLEALNL